LEVLLQLNARTAHMTEAQRENALASIFSARAGGGLTAIMQALENGVRNSAGEIVTGAGAIAELRRQMPKSVQVSNHPIRRTGEVTTVACPCPRKVSSTVEARPRALPIAS
jgi:hypothetical protein